MNDLASTRRAGMPGPSGAVRESADGSAECVISVYPTASFKHAATRSGRQGCVAVAVSGRPHPWRRKAWSESLIPPRGRVFRPQPPSSV